MKGREVQRANRPKPLLNPGGVKCWRLPAVAGPVYYISITADPRERTGPRPWFEKFTAEDPGAQGEKNARPAPCSGSPWDPGYIYSGPA